MCGIAGRASVDVQDHSEVASRMARLLVHRGPDSGGIVSEPNATLAIRRLRVIDLVTGDQPMANEDRTVWTVFNGEIYNFKELTAELRAQGHTFRTSSDTEVIVHLYEQYGVEFARRLEGMYAIAVWETRSRTLVLVRDRLGKKPLLYTEADGGITFASEHAALLASLDRRASANDGALRLYLRYGFVPGRTDAFREIHKLLPAHVLVWRDGRSRTFRYWDLPARPPIAIAEEEAVREVRRLVDAAVARRLVADVPVGAFLSGGIDSSCVVAAMAKREARVKTFTITFREREYSEAAHARRVAERFGTDHHEMVVDPTDVGVLSSLVRHYGEPYADSSALPTFHLSRLTRQHVTVALNGDGGDEVFGGYDRYRAMRLAAQVPAFAAVPLGSLARLTPLANAANRSRAGRVARFLSGLARPPRERYLHWLGIFSEEQLTGLLDVDFERRTRGASVRVGDHDTFDRDPVTAAQLSDLSLYLPDDLLVKVDIASMANSLEVRSPLLDREIVEFALSLPASLRLRNGTSKYVLKRAFAGEVPAENLRRGKQGFGVPIGAWLRSDLSELIRDTVLSDRALARGYFRRVAVETLVSDHVAGRADHTHRLWALLMLELWHREVLEA